MRSAPPATAAATAGTIATAIDTRMLLGRLKENEYNGRVNAQFFVEDVAI